MPARLMPKSGLPWDGEQAAMLSELAALKQQQRDSLERATYIGMSARDVQEYERRAARITEIQRALGVKPEATNDLW